MNVFEQLENQKRAERQQQSVEYWQLLSRINYSSPSDDDADQLFRLMRAMGKNQKQGTDDWQKVQAAKRAKEQLDAYVERDAAYVKAHEAHLAICAERQQQVQSLNAKVTEAAGVMGEAFDGLQSSNQARAELARLKESDPLIWSAVCDPTPLPTTEATTETKAKRTKK
jgi:hypothetical protein